MSLTQELRLLREPLCNLQAEGSSMAIPVGGIGVNVKCCATERIFLLQLSNDQLCRLLKKTEITFSRQDLTRSKRKRRKSNRSVTQRIMETQHLVS